MFSGIGFLFRLLPVFLLIYLLTPKRYRSISMFFGSLVYYAALEPHFVWILLLFVILNASFAAPRSRWRMLILVSLDAALLVAAKIYSAAIPDTPLPVGISFYIFKMISFQADLYTGRLEKKPAFFQTAEYFVMFPQLLQGPISRYAELYPAGEKKCGHRFDIGQAEEGLTLLMAGVCMKVLLADRLGLLWEQIRRIGYESISTPLAWLGAYGYSFRLYYDFWGYSLMAAGLLMIFGFPYVENFRHPYAAGGIADFYRRWHISLGRFFRDYVYIPLGGSRGGRWRTAGNLALVWALTGIWHGQSVNFLIWSGVLLLLILWEKFVLGGLLQRAPIIGRLHVWILIPVTWVIFALQDGAELRNYISRLFPLFGEGVNVNPGDWQKLAAGCVTELALSLLLLIPGVSAFFVKHKNKVVLKLLLFAVFWFALYSVVISSSNPFMYLNF